MYKGKFDFAFRFNADEVLSNFCILLRLVLDGFRFFGVGFQRNQSLSSITKVKVKVLNTFSQ